ncbi:MAG: hypothetical protein FWH28_04605 [Clostridiales bacterium]|nr:hypothetical protein [Clostridiales bacterium]
MDISSAMSTFGFGHRNSNQVVIDHEGELWCAIAPTAAVGGLHTTASGLPGMLRLEPLMDGEYKPFTYTATEALLEITLANGTTIKIATDKEAQAIRFTGNAALRLNGVENILHSTITLKTQDGIVATIGRGNRYLITAKKGTISVDDGWNYKIFTSVTPVLTIEPDAGELELFVFDLPADRETPQMSKSFDACVAESSADFQAFLGEIIDVPTEWSDVKEKIAYPLWLCHRMLNETSEVIVENKCYSAYSDATLMAIASMAFKDVKKAIDMILAYPLDFPPVAGVAAARLIEENMLNDARGDIFRVYARIEAFLRRCIKERTVDREGLIACMYRFENGIDELPAYFSVGEPVFTPDINAYLIVAGEVLGKLAHREYDVGAGRKWETYAKELKAAFLAKLWDGENFIGINAYTGEVSGPDSFLSLVPVILGSRLPNEIVRKLVARIDEEATDSAVGLLLAGGLYDAGEEDAAKGIAIEALNSVRRESLECPFYGASLLALAHKVL